MIAIPASFASIVVSLMNMINSVTVARCLQNAGIDIVTATEIWGQLSQKVQTVINVPMLLGVGLAAALVPAISESLATNNQKELEEKTSLALRTVVIITFLHPWVFLCLPHPLYSCCSVPLQEAES